MYSRESVRPRMMFLQRLSIQNHSKLYITMKKRKNIKCLTWNSISLKFVKKTGILNLDKSLGCIKCYSPNSPRSIKSPNNSIRYNCHKICSWQKRPETILEIWKKSTFFEMINKAYRVVVFSCRPLPNILKYRDHRWELPTIWKKRFLQTHNEEFNWNIWISFTTTTGRA